MTKKSRKKTAAQPLITVFIILIALCILLLGMKIFSGEAESSKPDFASPQTQLDNQSQPDESSPSGDIFLPEGLEYPKCAGEDRSSAPAADHQLRSFGSDYRLCYRESYESAEWAAYLLEKKELVKNASRTDDFRSDPEIITGSSTPAEYRRSGYDRGHLAPAADFAYSADAMSSTFYMSNMTAQFPAFNRGIWKALEEQVRIWAEEYGRVYVVCGPVFDESAASYATIGANGVAIPRFFYKVVLAPIYKDEEDAATPETCESLTAHAYIIPNEKCDEPFTAYSCTIDEVEHRTGIDFFYLLDDEIENAVESKR